MVDLRGAFICAKVELHSAFGSFGAVEEEDVAEENVEEENVAEENVEEEDVAKDVAMEEDVMEEDAEEVVVGILEVLLIKQ